VFGPDTPAGQHPLLARVQRLHGHARRRHQCDFNELERDLEALDGELRAVLAHCQPCGDRPAAVTVTATLEGQPMSSFAPGATITFTAVSDNAEQQPVADTYTWATTAGTIVSGADSTTITISDAPLGDVTVTATDPAGLAGSVTVTVADQTPASVTVTAA
jgi:hypothetical protein